MAWDNSCTADRRHLCMINQAAESSSCSSPFYALQLCVKYFPEAGLLNKADAAFHCSVHGGKLAEIADAYNHKNPDRDTQDYVDGKNNKAEKFNFSIQ